MRQWLPVRATSTQLALLPLRLLLRQMMRGEFIVDSSALSSWERMDSQENYLAARAMNTFDSSALGDAYEQSSTFAAWERHRGVLSGQGSGASRLIARQPT